MGTVESQQSVQPENDDPPVAADLTERCAKRYGKLSPLFCSPMNKMITLRNVLGVPTIHAMTQDGSVAVKMRGITKSLMRCFYPNYKYSGTVSRAHEQQLAKSSGYKTLPRNNQRAAAACRRRVRGAPLGIKVDYQLRLYANVPDKFTKLGARVLATTRDFITAYDVWDWKVVKSQFPIAAPDIRTGTCIDMVAHDRHGNPVLIENKTGFEGYLYKGNGHMRWPLTDVDNRPLHQHFLQLFVEAMIIRDYWGLDFGRNCYVVQATPNGVTPYRIPDWLLARGPDIWEAYRTHMRVTMDKTGTPRKMSSPAAKRRRVISADGRSIQ